MKEINVKDDSLFYCDIEPNKLTNGFVSKLREYSTKNSKQMYILKRALGTGKDYTYDLSDIAIVLMPEHPILLVNYGEADEEDLEDFLLDFKEDLGFLSDKYIFVDESQDFKEGFFKLCEKITQKTVYIAGDIFQNIYDSSNIKNINPDFLLNKCYRTDPKTLMFAHAVGMGLYESPQINWLDDSAQIACGYSLERDNAQSIVTLSRKPLRRFEDLDATNTVRLSKNNSCSYSEEILKAIDEIKHENPTVAPDDIAVIILSNYKTLCSIADETVFLLESKYGWNSTRGYISKHKQKDMVYISNENNVKGLEFPFVICVVPRLISPNVLLRNSIYMALTRSFLTSYFIVDS